MMMTMMTDEPFSQAINDSATTAPTPFLPWDNPHTVISLPTFRQIEFVFNCVLDPLLWLLGVSTNLVNCAVFYRQGLRDRMNLCLFSLAVVDAVYLSCNLVVDSHRFIPATHPALVNWVNVYLLVYLSGPNIALMLTSGAITMIVAIERCICVALPMKAASLISTRAMGCVLVFVVLLLQVAGAGTLTSKFKVVSLLDKSGTTIYAMVTTQFYKQNRSVMDAFEFIFVSPVLPITTFIVVSLCTAITVVQLRLALAWRASVSAGGESGTGESSKRLSQQQAALIKVLVLVSCLYIACSAPSVAMAVTRFAVSGDGFKPWGRYANTFFTTHDVSFTLAAVNSSFNFFIYLWRSSRYRQTLSSMVPCLQGLRVSTGSFQTTTQTSSIAVTNG